MITDPSALLAFMFLVVGASRLLEARVGLIARIGSAVSCTLLGIALSNLAIIPHTSAIHEAVYDIAIPYTIVLVILSSRLADLRRAGPLVLLAFCLACCASLIGGIVAGVLFSGWVGPEAWKISGMFVAAFTGGGMNFAAVGRGLDCPPGLFAASAMADNLSTVPWLLTVMFASPLLAPFYGRRPRPAVSASAGPASAEGARAVNDAPVVPDPEDDPRRFWASTVVSLTDLAVLAGLPLAILWAARLIGSLLPGFPNVLWVTTIAIAIAQFPPIHRLKGASVLSYFSLHLFFIVIGASSVLSEVVLAGPGIVLLMVTTIAIHAALTWGVGWFLRMDERVLGVASMATVGGPGSTLALTMGMKWTELVTPGVIIAVFGWVVGNYFGFACAYLVRALV